MAANGKKMAQHHLLLWSVCIFASMALIRAAMHKPIQIESFNFTPHFNMLNMQVIRLNSYVVRFNKHLFLSSIGKLYQLDMKLLSSKFYHAKQTSHQQFYTNSKPQKKLNAANENAADKAIARFAYAYYLIVRVTWQIIKCLLTQRTRKKHVLLSSKETRLKNLTLRPLTDGNLKAIYI